MRDTCMPACLPVCGLNGVVVGYVWLEAHGSLWTRIHVQIACKYEEIYPPEVKELVYMTDGAYTRKQVRTYE